MRRRAFSLAELLIAMSIFSVVLVVALGILQWALRGSQAQEADTRAAFLAQSKMEELFEVSHPDSGTGRFEGPQQEFYWRSDVHQDQDGFFNIAVSITGPRGCALKLQARRRSSHRDLLFANDGALVQASEDYKDREAVPGSVGSAFCLAPDGVTVAYVHDHEGKPQIFTRRLDDSAAGKMLFEHPQGAQQPVYSPNGERLAFVAQDNGFEQVFVYDFKSKLFENIGRSSHQDSSPTWTPDGKGLVVSRDGASIVLLVPGKETVLVEEGSGWNACPHISPDGKDLVFMSNRDGNPEIYLEHLATRKVTRLTDNPAYDTEPRFSSDGKRILFSSDREGHIPQLFTMNIDGSGVEAMTNNSTPTDASWTP